MQRRGESVQDKKLADAERLLFAHVISPGVGFPEAKFRLPVPESHLLGDAEDILGGQVVQRILQVEGRNARDVRRDADVVVRNAHGSPNTADVFRSFAEDLEMPDFVGVGNRQALARIAVAVLLNQFSDEMNGVAGGGTALQGDASQFFDHEHAILVLKFLSSGDGSLADAELFLVEAGVSCIHELISRVCLGDLALQFAASLVVHEFRMHSPFVNRSYRVIFINRGRNNVNPRAVIPIAGVAGYHRAISRCFLSDHNTCTALRVIYRPGELDVLRRPIRQRDCEGRNPNP